MKTNITTKAQAKTAVSALRREIKAMHKGSEDFSYSDCLELMAKALGFPSWNTWQATLAEDQNEKPAAAPTKPKYPLTNDNGEFDFIKPGEEGIPLQGDFEPLENTFEVVEAKANVRGARRATSAKNPGIGDSGLIVQHHGSDIFDDTMETKTENGRIVWLSDNGDEYSGVVVLAPQDSPAPEFDESLPVRAKLLEAYLQYFADVGVDDSAREGVFDNAQAVLGIWLTEREGEHLLDQLREKGLA
jgi:hypothetical protein